MNTEIIINEPAPNTASEESLIAALVQALWDAPGIVTITSGDVQSSQPPMQQAA